MKTDTPAWRKSSYSGGSGGNCVEVADTAAVIAVRDTRDPDGGTLTFTAATWQSFANSLK